MKDLNQAIDLVEIAKAELAIVRFVDFASYEEYQRRRRQAIDKAVRELATAGALCGDGVQDASFKFAGIRSTCTGGFEGALSNWLAAARKKLAQQEPAQ
jgi:hypothetical protein